MVTDDEVANRIMIFALNYYCYDFMSCVMEDDDVESSEDEDEDMKSLVNMSHYELVLERLVCKPMSWAQRMSLVMLKR